jgi:hypothetical protein
MKKITIKFNDCTDSMICAVLLPNSAPLLRCKNKGKCCTNIKTSQLEISEEEDVYIHNYAIGAGVSKAEVIEGIMIGLFSVGITAQSKRWIIDTIAKKAMSLKSKKSAIRGLIFFAMSMSAKNKKIQEAIATGCTTARGEVKRNYQK